MCPGAALPSATTRLTSASMTSGSASSTAGSRLPCSVLPGTSPVACASGVRQSTPVTSAPVSAMAASRCAVPTPKWIRGTARPASGGGAVRQDEPPVVGLGQRAGPRVEQLDRPGAGVDLHVQERAGDGGQPAGKVVPEVGPAQHEGLRAGEGAGRAALDQVARQGERRPGEADQRRTPEFGDEQPARPPRWARRPRRPARRSASIWPWVRIGSAKTGPVPATMSTVDSGRRQRDDDVGEQDGRVDPVPAYRLHGDLGDQIGGPAGLQHRHPSPHRVVLRQRSTGLPHEPDRHRRRGFTPYRGDHVGAPRARAAGLRGGRLRRAHRRHRRTAGLPDRSPVAALTTRRAASAKLSVPRVTV